MQLKNTILVVAILAVAVCADQISDLVAKIPACALTCLTPAIGAAGCGLTDYVCQCTTGYNTILAKSAGCVQSGCSTQDALTTTDIMNQICALATSNSVASSAAVVASTTIAKTSSRIQTTPSTVSSTPASTEALAPLTTASSHSSVTTEPTTSASSSNDSTASSSTATTTPQAAASTSSTNNTAAIAGGVVGGVIGLAAIIGAMVYFVVLPLRRRIAALEGRNALGRNAEVGDDSTAKPQQPFHELGTTRQKPQHELEAPGAIPAELGEK